jgi:cytochrome P450
MREPAKDTEPAGACPVHNYSPLELKPLGEWAAFYDLFREAAPVIKNEFGGGYYVLTRHEDILGVFQDPDTFSTDSVVAYERDPAYKWIPHMIGGQEHRQWRQQLAPAFAPRAVEQVDGRVRERAGELVTALSSRGSCDFMKDFALQFPTSIILDVIGLPQDHLGQFMEWEEEILHAVGDPEDVVRRKVGAIGAVKAYFADTIAQRRLHPAEDLVTQSLGIQIDGRPVTDDELLNYWQFLLQAGLDTVAAMLGYYFHHLATHPADRRRIVDDPAVIPSAQEEMMRVYSFIVSARKALKDTEIAGCPIEAGSMVQLVLKMSGHDEAVYPNALTVDFDRGPFSHLAFGAGPHRCLGSHLARRELRIALEEWHKLIPDYRLGEGAPIVEFGRSSGINTLPLVWDV